MQDYKLISEGLDGLATVASIGFQYGMGNNYSILLDTGFDSRAKQYVEKAAGRSQPYWWLLPTRRERDSTNRFGVGIPFNFGGDRSSVGFPFHGCLSKINNFRSWSKHPP